MKMTQVTRRILACRRMSRDLKAKGYERVSGPWELDRGGRTRERIVDVVIDAGGKDLWVRCEEHGNA